MEAVIVSDFDDASVEEVERPSPTADEVLLRVRRVQLSVTECNLYRGNQITHYETIRSRLDDGPARLFGHEFCAEVAETGDDVEEFETGDRVYAPGKIPCGECRFCERGFESKCGNKSYLGYDRPGALAEYFTSPTKPLAKVHDEVTDAEAAAMQPLASTVLCIRDADITTGDVVVVVGTGVMGNQAGQLALQEGADEVYATDIDPEKLRIASDNGLEAIDTRETDPVREILDRTDGIGADVVIEAVGGDQSSATEGDDPIAQAFGMARPGGSVVQIGHLIGDLTLRPREIRSMGVDWLHPTIGAAYLTPNTHSGDYASRLVAQDRVSIDEYVTHEFDGLGEFERMIDVTLNKQEYDALGPAQLVL